jgi:hypothetical protein
MADWEEAQLAPSCTLALLSLPPAARAPAMHAVLAIIFGRLNTAGPCRVRGPNREPTPTDSERSHAISGDAGNLINPASALPALELTLDVHQRLTQAAS